MSESSISALLSIDRLSLILMALIAIIALMRDRKSTKAFWEAILKLFHRLL